jgi:hypothetical protein
MYIHKEVTSAVAHACNPSYSGDRDQEDHGLMSVQANSSGDPILKKKKNHHKKGWWSGSRCMPWVQTPVSPCQKVTSAFLWILALDPTTGHTEWNPNALPRLVNRTDSSSVFLSPTCASVLSFFNKLLFCLPKKKKKKKTDSPSSLQVSSWV